jgi:hypothetical protein
MNRALFGTPARTLHDVELPQVGNPRYLESHGKISCKMSGKILQEGACDYQDQLGRRLTGPCRVELRL